MRNILFFFLGILAFLWVPFDAIDSYRYYQFTDLLDSDLSLGAFILFNFAQTFDFIYYLLFYICLKLNIPVQLVTGVSIGLIFQQSFKFIDIITSKYNLKLNLTDYFLIQAFTVLCVSFVTLFGISRFVTAIMFFVFGLNFLFKGRNVLANIFFILAVFTHIGFLVYLMLFYLGYKWDGKLLNNLAVRRFIMVLVIISGLSSFLWISPVLKVISLLWVIQSEYDYTKYFDVNSSSNILGFDLGYGDVLMFFTVFMTLTFSLFALKKYNKINWVTLVMYTWLVISMGFSQMWVQRTILFLIPLQGVHAAIFFNENRNNLYTHLFRGILIVSIITFFINVYSYRGSWVFAWPRGD